MPHALWARALRSRSATIALPLMLPGVLAGAITAFSAALGEFGAVITFVSNIPARRAPCRWRCTPRCRHREAMSRRHAWQSFPACSDWAACCCRNGLHGACGACWAGNAAGHCQKARGAFALDAKFELPTPGRRRTVRPLRLRQNHAGQRNSRVARGRYRPGALDDNVLLDTDRKMEVPPEKRRIGYVFQDARLFPHMTGRGEFALRPEARRRIAVHRLAIRSLICWILGR